MESWNGGFKETNILNIYDNLRGDHPNDGKIYRSYRIQTVLRL